MSTSQAVVCDGWCVMCSQYGAACTRAIALPVSRLLNVIMSASRPAAFISSYTCSALSRRPPFSHADIKACWWDKSRQGPDRAAE